VNCYLIAAAEPVLVDTGLAHDRGPLLDALAREVDLADLRWIVLTHDDRDHAGNLRDLLLAALERRSWPTA
jgi:flavorubredoxin